MKIVILAGYMLNSRDSTWDRMKKNVAKKSSISWMEMGRNSCCILCMAAIKQESVFDEEKILIPYKM